MNFFRLPRELRDMVYQELCPEMLKLPSTYSRQGLGLLLTSHQAREEYLPHVRAVNSIKLHALCKEEMHELFTWLLLTGFPVSSPLTNLKYIQIHIQINIHRLELLHEAKDSVDAFFRSGHELDTISVAIVVAIEDVHTEPKFWKTTTLERHVWKASCRDGDQSTGTWMAECLSWEIRAPDTLYYRHAAT